MQAWTLYALGSAFFASLTAIFAKFGVQGLNSNVATWFRTIVVIVVLSVIISVRKEWALPEQAPARTWLFLAVSGLCTGLSWICYFRALQMGPVSKVAPIDKLSIAMTILLAALILKESIDAKTAIGGALVVAGAIVLAL